MPPDYEVLGNQLYEALKAAQQEYYFGDDIDEVKVEKALQAWERRFIYEERGKGIND